MKANPLLLLALFVATIGAAIGALSEDNAMSQQTTQSSLPVEGALPSLDGATLWLNTQPLEAKKLRGKVVVVQFWTYTCINWLRTLAYTRAWAEKYKDQGVVVIGVHAPEFEFEKNLDNVRRETKALNVGYPVAVDSNHAIWRAFDNQYWPALYIVDAEGRIRYHQFGEGEYDRSEEVIQKLLAEAGHLNVARDLVLVRPHGVEVAAAWNSLRSPENYVGTARTENFVSPGGAVPEKSHLYTVPAQMGLNDWGLAGDWTMKSQLTALNKPGGRLAYRFHARDVHLVMGPAMTGAALRFRVRIDGKPPGAAHGLDVDAEGNGTLREQRLYQLIRQSGPIADRGFEIEFLDAGAELFAFTFG